MLGVSTAWSREPHQQAVSDWGVGYSVSAIPGCLWVLGFLHNYMGKFKNFVQVSLKQNLILICGAPQALVSSCSKKNLSLALKPITANSRWNLNCLILVSSLKERAEKILYYMGMNNKIIATDLWLSSYRKMLCLLPWSNWITMLLVP